MKKATFATIFFLVFALSAFSQPVKPHTFSPADPVSSAKMNANFDTIYQWGSVASAAIELHKADTAAHGATGGVVGATKTQTLTNKSISGEQINSGTVADARVASTLARDSEVSTAVSTHAALTATHGATGAVVGTTDTQTLTNKTIGTTNSIDGGAIKTGTVADARIDSALARDSEVTSAVSTHAALTATHGATGAVMGTTNTQTVTNKTLDSTNSVDGGAIKSGTVADARIASTLARWGATGADANAVTNSGFFHASANIPTTDGESDKALIHNQYGGGYTWATQIAQSWRNGRAWIRNKENGTWEPWHEIWTTNNDGSGSGLDADTLDGNNSSFFATAASLAGYLPLAGGTMSGVLTLKNDVHGDSYSTGALNLRNSNIYGANGFFFGDAVDSTTEGIHFYNSSTTTDWFYAVNGALYFNPNRPIGAAGTNYAVWHAGNDGSGSGLDADTLDGANSSAFASTAVNNTYAYLGATYISGGAQKPNYFGSGKLKLQMLSGGNVGAPDSWNDCLWLSSYSGGDVKPSNVLIFGKYTDSIGFCRQDYDSTTWGTYRKIWHSGNQGSGSGLDADKLEGYHAVTANTASTIPIRNSDGDITTRLFRSTYAEQTTAPATTADIAFRNDTSDNYIRFMDAAAFKAWLINSKIGVVQTSAPASPVDGDIWVE